MCLFPAVIHSHEIVLTTCTNGRDTTWDTALARGYTLIPKPFNELQPNQLRRAGSLEILRRAWRTRREHSGLVAAFRAERSEAIEQTRLENERRQADTNSAQRRWQEQHDRARDAFRMRHS